MYLIQRQVWRFTNCRCLIEDLWDGLALGVFLILAAAGFFWLLEELYKAFRPESKKKIAREKLKSLELYFEQKGQYINLDKLKYIKENLLN